MPRDYKDEYKKFQSGGKMRAYRAKLNAENRKRGTYGNGDGKDLSHKSGGLVQEDQSANRGRKEKSRLKGSKRAQSGGLLQGNSHDEGGIQIEAEGGEIMVNKTINNAAGMHEEELLALNENPEDYKIVRTAEHGGLIEKDATNRSMVDMLEYVVKHGDIPMSDARKRSKK